MTAIATSAWLSERIEDGVLVISILAERLDPQVHKKYEYVRLLDDAIAAGHTKIVLDLSELRYTNNVWGLFQLIFSATYRLHEAGGKLAVCGLSGHPRRTFLFAELDRYLPDYRSVDAAVHGLNAL